MSTTRSIAAIGASILFVAGIANASITGVGGGDFSTQPAGWDQPPATLGSWAMTNYDTFDPFVGELGNTTTATSDPLSTHFVTFDSPVSHRYVTSTWLTWSGGYTGSVYHHETSNIVTITLAPGTVAFSLFFEPNQFDLVDFTLIGADSDGNTATVIQNAHGSSGATWAGFYTDGSTTLNTIIVRAAGSELFAMGRFSYALVPAPGALALIGVAGLAGVRRRRN